MTPGRICDLELRVDPAEVRRYLGYPRLHRPRPSVQRRLDALWEKAHALARPRGVCRVADGERLAAIGMPRPTPRVAVAVCTLSGALEDESRRRGERGDLLDAMILDAFGSAAAEAAADALNGEICIWAHAQGLHPAPRISPGYGAWSVEAQAAFLGLLPAASLGVRLTPALMLVPHKSVSFAVRFPEKRPAEVSRVQKCKHCGLPDCPYREGPAPGVAGPPRSLDEPPACLIHRLEARSERTRHDDGCDTTGHSATAVGRASASGAGL